MEERMITNYREVSLDTNGKGGDRHYKNPLTKTYQYEYALYLAVSELFGSVRPLSMSLESLKLYFYELHVSKDGGGNSGSREGLVREMRKLVSRDVTGNIIFPMMDVCAAEVMAVPDEDGTHRFIFTDGVYGFGLKLRQDAGHPTGIELDDLTRKKQVAVCDPM
ncbi:MAG: hypothetical protein K6B44_05770 [Lachnospiraceae bacterium]|nr:hypothetical protein [Lachnospiraceae bacterium]